MKVINNKWRSWSRDEVGSFFFLSHFSFSSTASMLLKDKAAFPSGWWLDKREQVFIMLHLIFNCPLVQLRATLQKYKTHNLWLLSHQPGDIIPAALGFFFFFFFKRYMCVLFKSRVTNYQKNDWQSYDCFNFAKSVYILRRRDISWGWTELYFCVILICTTTWCSESR